ncbi:hypothetical protein V2I01_34485 [Micromonospora sp. BRA006-A]|nr:hypothetical protein [Micromonospora sp. BRA006-A]
MHPRRRHLTRRHLLGATAAAGVTGLATGCEPDCPAGGTAAPDDAPALDPASWDSVRAQFALDHPGHTWPRSSSPRTRHRYGPPWRSTAPASTGTPRATWGSTRNGWTARCWTRRPGTSAPGRSR